MHWGLLEEFLPRQPEVEAAGAARAKLGCVGATPLNNVDGAVVLR